MTSSRRFDLRHLGRRRHPGGGARGNGTDSTHSTHSTVHLITGARRGVRDDVDDRTRRYLISMGIRTACFILAVVTSGWLRWTFAFGAIALPYLAVVFANSGRERIETLPELPDSPDGAGPTGPGLPGSPAERPALEGPTRRG